MTGKCHKWLKNCKNCPTICRSR